MTSIVDPQSHLKAAKAIGLTIPPKGLLGADEVNR